MAKELETWHRMSKEEAVRYWQEGLGEEIAYYDSKFEENAEIEKAETILKTLIQFKKLTKNEIKRALKALNISDETFEVLYNRNI